MKTISITGLVRESLGKKNAKQARRNERVPCVLYGGESPIHFTLSEVDFNKIIYTPEVYNVLITVDGTEYSSILKEAQFHPVTDKPVHADFLLIQPNKPVTVSMPVVLTGASIGIKNGGKLRTPMRKLKIKGPLENIPDNIEIDITKLRIGQSIKVGLMQMDGIEFLDPATNVIVAVKTARGAIDLGDEELEEAEGTTAEA